MSLEDIEIFVKIVDHNSFSAAAELLRLPKSTVSRRFSHMEENLGVKLLNRTTRQLSLTTIGEAYYGKCLAVMNQLEEANNLLKGLQTNPKGRLRLSIPTELGLFFLKDTITEFLKAYPEIELELELANRMVDLVEEGYDLALRIGSLPDSSLTAVKLGTMRGGIYASPDFLKNRVIPQSPSQLPLLDCIQFRTTQVHKWVFQGPNNEMIKINPQGRLQVNSMRYISDSAADGLGIGAINRSIAAPFVKEGKLVEILQEYKVTFANIFAVYPSRKFLSPNVRTFVDFIKPRIAKILE